MLFRGNPSGKAKLTRRTVANRLGVSVSTVRRMEGIDLHPYQDERGVWCFDGLEVEAIAAKQAPRPAKVRNSDAGQIAARVFEAFQAGYGLSDIVIELTRTPPRATSCQRAS
jgi:hypothetical protein